MIHPMRRHHSRRRAFSLVETVVSVVIVAGLFVAAMNAVGASQAGQYILTGRCRGMLLAQDLMAEVLRQAYWDPAVSGGMGPDADEGATGDRSLFDDVDDYNDWSASPPQLKDGSPVSNASGFARRVVVEWVSPQDLDATSGAETDAKRIIVTVTQGGRVVAKLTAVRTRLWIDPTDNREAAR